MAENLVRNPCRYSYAELMVVGYGGTVGSRDLPYLLDPLYQIVDTTMILAPPCKADEAFVMGSGAVPMNHLLDSVLDGSATRLEPSQAIPDGCLYAPVGKGSAIYTTRKVVLAVFLQFVVEQQAIGARCLASKDFPGALHAYRLAAAISQEPEDYARVSAAQLAVDALVSLRRASKRAPWGSKRVSAPEVVKQYNWTVGTVLLSSTWKAPREIMEIRKDFVLLLTRHPQARKEFVRSFPADVHAFMIV